MRGGRIDEIYPVLVASTRVYTRVPQNINPAIQTLLLFEHCDWSTRGQVSQWVDDNELSVSKYADGLEHVDSGRKISSDPKTWLCEDSGKTENLWLNLSTGEDDKY